ncbi:hypothetical protein ABZP36_012098 [Zizania latifolia]
MSLRGRICLPVPLAAATLLLNPVSPQFGAMALANKLSNLLKKVTSSSPALYQSIRCMSSSKLFVGGLSYGTDEQRLRDTFANYGEVIEAKIITDRETGRSRGFGFITYTSTEEASAAITALDGKVNLWQMKFSCIMVIMFHDTKNCTQYGGVGQTRSGGGDGFGVSEGAGGSDVFSGTNFGSDSGFGGNPASAGGSTSGDLASAAGDSFESSQNNDLMDDLFKDDEPDNYAKKG